MTIGFLGMWVPVVLVIVAFLLFSRWWKKFSNEYETRLKQATPGASAKSLR